MPMVKAAPDALGAVSQPPSWRDASQATANSASACAIWYCAAMPNISRGRLQRALPPVCAGRDGDQPVQRAEEKPEAGRGQRRATTCLFECTACLALGLPVPLPLRLPLV